MNGAGILSGRHAHPSARAQAEASEPLPARRETLRTPAGELVSLPRVRRRSWVLTILLVVAVLVALMALLLTHQPGASSPGGAQPTPVISGAP